MTETTWYDVKTNFPKLEQRLGSVKHNESVVVLVWVGENGYSHRECTLAYYNYGYDEWEFIERKYADFPVRKWSYLPTEDDLEDSDPAK